MTVDFSKIKLAFFDIDGTLIGKSGQLTERTIAAINRLKSKGVRIALATGRPLFGARKIADQLQVDCFSLFSSGGLIANPKNDEILFEARIEDKLVKECIKISRRLGLYLEIYTKDAYFVETENSITAKHIEYLQIAPSVVDFDNLRSDLSVNKFVAISDSPELEENQKKLIGELDQLVCLCSKGASHPEILFNNITSSSANRIDGFYKILKSFNLEASEVISFGDSISDTDFISLSGIGVAMAEAPEVLKQKAKIIADSPENDGVAKIIDQMLRH